jgi:hypothetical protein
MTTLPSAAMYRRDYVLNSATQMFRLRTWRSSRTPRMTLLPEFLNLDKRNILCNAVDNIDHCHFYYDCMFERLLRGIVATPGSKGAR